MIRVAAAFGVILVLLCATSGFGSERVVLIAEGSTWSYLDEMLPDDGWRDLGYDDRHWKRGPAPLGYGESVVATSVSFGDDETSKHPTLYLRQYFDLHEDPKRIEHLLLRVNFDDGIVVSLNGFEIARRVMPIGVISHETRAAASHEAGEYEAIDLTAWLHGMERDDDPESGPPTFPRLNRGPNVLTVEIHQVTPDSPDLFLDAELSYSLEAGPAVVEAKVTRGPYLQRGSPTSAVIRWRTELATNSSVLLGTVPGEPVHRVESSVLRRDHEIVLAGLNAGERYFYSVGSTVSQVVGGDKAHYVDTHPVRGARPPVRIWVIGDSGTADERARRVRDAYLHHPGADDTDVWLMLGDNAYDSGTDSEYQDAVFEMYPMLLRNTFLWPTRGNHDSPDDYYEIFQLPRGGESGGLASGTEKYYSFDYANVHFVCLDSQGSDRSPGAPMLTWLEQDLAANTQDWTIAYWHHPPYSKGSHDSDSETTLVEMRENALPILEAGGVDLVLSGHSHSYERSHLINGHYGRSPTLSPAMILDAGDGNPDGDGPYRKATLAPQANSGTVYNVTGCSGKVSWGSFDHPVMVVSKRELGSLVLDIHGPRLDGAFLQADGAVTDRFTIRKGSTQVTGTGDPTLGAPSELLISDVTPNPFTFETRIGFFVPVDEAVRLAVYDVGGRLVRTLVEEPLSAGAHQRDWNGRDERARTVAPGVYFLSLEVGDRVRTKKITHLR